jgi:hypothetical protein
MPSSTRTFPLRTRLLPALGLAAWLALSLGGCDDTASRELQPGIATEAQVRDRFGVPGMEWENADGSVTLEYARGPEGVKTWMITLGPDRVLQRIEQVLDDAHFARIQPGMSENEVRRLLGRPGRVRPVLHGSGTEWQWRFAGLIANEEWHFYVTFDPQGKVVRSERLQTLRP